MHQPRPYGLAVEGGVLTERDQAFISATVLRFTNFKQAGQLDSLRKYYNLPDGGYCVVQDMANIFKVLAYKQSETLTKPTGKAHLYIPMLFSGVFGRCFYRDDEPWLSIKLTEQCRLRLDQYKEPIAPKEKTLKDIELERFAIEYPNKFQYLKPQISGPYFKHSQYMRIKPTLYSGAMAEVVQIISGYGRLYNEKYKGSLDKPLENAQMALPEEWYEKIEQEIRGYALPGYSGYPDPEGFIQYDYKPGQNDLVAFDSDKNPWLLRIQASGVFAMPLPIVPATSTKAFRQYIELIGDDEILKILDRFKAMPSGETFPIGDDFEAWKRAGAIIKICDSSQFYQYQPMYGACGWSINSTGSEAFNTCYEYRADGLMQAYGYKATLKLGPITKNGWIEPKTTESKIISTYLTKLFALLEPGAETTKAIAYKVRRVDQEDIYQRALTSLYDPLGVTSSDVNYWHSYEADPIANHSGNLNRTTAGSVYWGLWMYPQSMGRFKFPTISGEGCESLVMISPDYRGPSVKSDTVIFGAYIEDQLRYVKYFIDERSVQKQTDSTFEDGMIVGQWEKTETNTPSGLSGYFYTTDADDRRINSPNTTYTKIVGTDLGYGNPAFQTPPVLYMNGSLSRSRYYKHVTVTETVSGDGMDCAICIPNFNRDCILYAFQESTDSKSKNEKHDLHAMADPTSYMLWTYDPIFHWLGNAGKGKPSPTTGDYVYVSGPPNYHPTEFSDFADSGDWYGVGNGYIDVSGICAPYTDRASGGHHGNGVIIGGEGPTIEPYDVTEHEENIQKGRVDIVYEPSSATTIHRKIPAAWYFSFSPVESGGSLSYFQRDACRVTFGDSVYANISDENASRERRHKWGYCSLVEHTSHYYFIGVINE